MCMRLALAHYEDDYLTSYEFRDLWGFSNAVEGWIDLFYISLDKD